MRNCCGLIWSELGVGKESTGKLGKACNWLAACKREESEQLEVMPKVSEPHEIALYLPQVPIRGNLFSLLVHSWIFSDSCYWCGCDSCTSYWTDVRGNPMWQKQD